MSLDIMMSTQVSLPFNKTSYLFITKSASDVLSEILATAVVANQLISLLVKPHP